MGKGRTLCSAKTRFGPCPELPEPGKKRCRLHGGAKGSGAPMGNQNAFKHGLTTKEGLAELIEMRVRGVLICELKAELKEISERKRLIREVKAEREKISARCRQIREIEAVRKEVSAIKRQIRDRYEGR